MFCRPVAVILLNIFTSSSSLRGKTTRFLIRLLTQYSTRNDGSKSNFKFVKALRCQCNSVLIKDELFRNKNINMLMSEQKYKQLSDNRVKKYMMSLDEYLGCTKIVESFFPPVHMHNSGDVLQSEKDIFEKYKHKFKHIKQHQCQAVFVLGPMGSGKTTVINAEFRNHNTYQDYAYVDTDEIMQQLEGFDTDSINVYYPIARRIAINLTDWILKEKISFVAEGTCVQYEELKDYILRLKSNGYHIQVRKLDNVTMEDAVQRASKRIRRKMDVNELRNIYAKSIKGLKELDRYNDKMDLFEVL